MAFDDKDYQRGAAGLGAEPLNLMAVSAIESSGENFWTLGNKQVAVIRPEAHWFSHYTGHKYDQSHPHISRPSWDPSVAAKSRAEAWDQFEEMAGLNHNAAIRSTSWGPFQIMGFHAETLGYDPDQFVDEIDGPDDDGQMDTFVSFVKADPRLLRAIRRGDWDTWETVYNGGGYGGAYARKIRDWLATHTALSPVEPRAPRTLVEGMQGEDVKRLQIALGIDADGIFGSETKRAVIRFQTVKGLTPDGIVGQFTKKQLDIF